MALENTVRLGIYVDTGLRRSVEIAGEHIVIQSRYLGTVNHHRAGGTGIGVLVVAHRVVKKVARSCFTGKRSCGGIRV